MKSLYLAALADLVYPTACAGCSRPLAGSEKELCLTCLQELPKTDFHLHRENPVLRSFTGRLPLERAGSWLYFQKRGRVQAIMHQFKYRAQQSLGLYMGRLAAIDWLASGFFDGVDALVPVPLHPRKEKLRGYNQAAVLAEGLSEVLGLPVWKDCIARVDHHESQTRKGRFARWLNVETVFRLNPALDLRGKHLMMVDDVITTGATLEGCIHKMLEAPGARFSIFTLAKAL